MDVAYQVLWRRYMHLVEAVLKASLELGQPVQLGRQTSRMRGRATEELMKDIEELLSLLDSLQVMKEERDGRRRQQIRSTVL